MAVKERVYDSLLDAKYMRMCEVFLSRSFHQLPLGPPRVAPWPHAGVGRSGWLPMHLHLARSTACAPDVRCCSFDLENIVFFVLGTKGKHSKHRTCPDLHNFPMKIANILKS